MTVSITYSFVTQGTGALGGGRGGANGIDGETDVVRYGPNGYAFVGRDGATSIGGVAGGAGFEGFPGTSPAIARLLNGNLVVVGENAQGIAYEIFDPAGNVVNGPHTNINPTTSSADVAALTNGGFVVAYTSNPSGSSLDHNIELRYYDAAGALTTAFPVNTSGFDDLRPRVAVMDNGNVVVAWHRMNGSETEIMYAIYGPSGLGSTGVGIVSPKVADTSGLVNRDVEICATDTGFAIVYVDTGAGGQTDVTLARYTFDGTALGATTVANSAGPEEEPHIARLDNGMLAVTYGTGTSPTQVNLRVFSGDDGVLVASTTLDYGLANQDRINTGLAAFGPGDIISTATDSNGADYQTLSLRRTSVSNAASDTITGDGLIDLMAGNDGDDILNGMGGDDALSGGNGADTLNGGSGIDTMVGGAGADTYFVDDNQDVVTELAGGGVDIVYSSAFSHTLYDNVENLVLVGSAVYGLGNALSNVITGNAGDNVIAGGAGADSMAGGLGDDVYEVDDVGDIVTEFSGQGTDEIVAYISYALTDAQSIERLGASFNTGAINLGGNLLANRIIGNNSANGVSGGGGDDLIYGMGGDDVLDGGAGVDVMLGGQGNDDYYVDNALDSVTEIVGDGTDRIFTTVSYTLSSDDEVEYLYALGSGAIDITGNNRDNIIVGNGATNVLDGDAGSDVLQGMGGNDLVRGDFGDDALDGGDGDDQLDGMYDDDYLSGGAGNDQIFGGTDFGSDVLLGGDGDDILNGGNGNDDMRGGAGNDTYVVDAVGDSVIEAVGEGIDTVMAYGSYALSDNLENLQLLNGGTGTGNALNNTLTGSAVVDTLVGGAGDDILDGAAGADILIGGTGNDEYRIDYAADTITELAGEGVDTAFIAIVGSSPTYILGDNVERMIAVVDTGLALTGNAQANFIAGRGGDDTLIGMGGDDILSGGAGADALWGEDGQDTADYADAIASVTASLVAGTGSVAGDSAVDVFHSIENLTGSAFADTLTGDAGFNVLSGGSGSDTLLGVDGNDVLIGGAGNDVLNGGNGFDTASYATSTGAVNANLTVGSTSNDGFNRTDSLIAIENLTGSDFSDILTGSGASNVLTGGAGDDQLFGLNGDDILIGGAGVDLMDGGGGNDTVTYEGVGAGVKAQLNTNAASSDGEGGNDVFAGVENLTGSGYNDTLIGDANANILRGGQGADTLLGLGGNDVLWGGAGALNTLQGGLGDDRYVLEAADTIVENANEGTDTVEVRFGTYILANNVENLVFGGSGAFSGTGNALANTITGGTGNDNLRGRGGVDVLNGGQGTDTVDYTLAAAGVTARLDLMRATNDGDGATDTFASIENLTGSNFDDLLIGDAGANVLMGGIGTDTLLGFGGNDILWGGSGGGNNQLQGGTGDDWYILDAFDTVVELVGEGIDTVEARIGSYTMGANIENLLYTGPGKFVGSGNVLDNTITGGTQNDILKGGGGNDTINGGLGSDEVQFRGTKAQYTVTVEGSGYRVVDTVAGRDGSTFVSSVEVLRFLSGNTTTALVYPPVAPAPLETTDKQAGPLVSPVAHDDFVLPDVLPALQSKAFEDGPLTLPGQDESHLSLRELFALHNGGHGGGSHDLVLQPDWLPDAVEHRDWM